MPHPIELRIQAGARNPGDIVVQVQDKTFDYLLSSPAPEIRVSAYLDRDWEHVDAMYAEIFVSDGCSFDCKVTKLIPGSRTRKDISLPGPMEEGEQLIIIVARTPAPK